MLTRIIMVIAIVMALVFVPFLAGKLLNISYDGQQDSIAIIWGGGVAAIIFFSCVVSIVIGVCVRLYDFIVDGI